MTNWAKRDAENDAMNSCHKFIHVSKRRPMRVGIVSNKVFMYWSKDRFVSIPLSITKGSIRLDGQVFFRSKS